jgi:hypoxanthine phosphoribosyltransferase
METEKLSLSWSDVSSDIEQLRAQCTEREISYDWVIGITVGGLIPLALLAKALQTRHVTTISAHSYDALDVRGAVSIDVLPAISLTGKKVLLVDEIADSGKTLHEIKKMLVQNHTPALVDTATLCLREDRCQHIPDMYARKVRTWVTFPWDSSRPE